MNGELSFFNDSIVRPYEYTGNVETLFKQYVNNHNNLVNQNKRFVPRNCTVVDPNDYITRANINYPTTKEEMNGKLIDILGGHFETGPNEDGTRWIDYLAEYEKTSSQLIQFGENLLDITQHISSEEVATRIVPLGAKEKDGEERLNIKSINNGLDYVQDDVAVALFGIIEEKVEYDDVNQASNLLTKGKTYLQEKINQTVSIELSAADLHNIDVNIEAFRIGDNVRVLSKPHGLDRYFLLSKLHLTLDSVSSCTMTLGATFKTFTQTQVENQKKINAQVSNAVLSVNTLSTEVKQAKEDVEKAKTDVAEMNVVIGEIPTIYVKTTTFEDYKTEINQKIASVYTAKRKCK